MEADDTGNLVFSPPQDRNRIWHGLAYLYDIDMPDSAGSGFFALFAGCPRSEFKVG
jgi:hypothetical protein